MNSNELDIDDLVNYVMKKNDIPNVPLQKYYRLKWFLNALEKDLFTFQKPSTWDDPFEDFISKLTNSSKKAFVNGLSISNDIYAMSTINKRSECDGMWKNFANTTGVLVHTNSKKIIKSLISYLLDNGCCSNRNLYLGGQDVRNQLAGAIKLKKIDYRPDSDIAKLFKDATNHTLLDYNHLAFEMLSIKRMEYDYESEYRVFLVANLLGLEESLFLGAGHFKKTIDKIVLSPKVSQTRINRLTSVLINKYQIDKNIIETSKLYDLQYFKDRYDL